MQKRKIYTIISLHDDVMPLEVPELSERTWSGGFDITGLDLSGKMEQYLRESGFSAVLAYSSYGKVPVSGSGHEILLYECSLWRR